MADRYFVKENGNGGFETIDRQTGQVVAHSAFEKFCDKAASRLMGQGDMTVQEAQKFYGVNTIQKSKTRCGMKP